MTFLWLSPVLLFIVMSAVRGVRPLWAAIAAATTATVVALSVAPEPMTAPMVVRALAAGAWTAVPAALIILAGIFFAMCVEDRDARSSGDSGADAKDLGHSRLLRQCLFAGPFVETATGFGVGYVAALNAVSRQTATPTAALTLAAYSQYLVPWGALAIGSQIGAGIAGIPVSELAWRIAILSALWIPLVSALFWRETLRAGHPAGRGEWRAGVAAIAALISLLLAANAILPIELAGLVAIGGALAIHYLLTNRRRSFSALEARRLAPYLMLMAALAAIGLVPILRDGLGIASLQPFAELAPFAPLRSPATPLVAIGFLVAARRLGASCASAMIASAVTRGWRAGLLTIVLVAMASLMVKSGISQALMQSATSAFGRRAVLLLPLASTLAGFVTGSNAGAAALTMPAVAGLAFGPMETAWAAASVVLSGSAGTVLSPLRLSMGVALLGVSEDEAFRAVPRIIALPVTAMAVALLALAVLVA